MANNLFDLWANDCLAHGLSLWRLEGEEKTGLFKTQKTNFTYMKSPVYHVWTKDGKHFATLNHKAAIDKWEAIKT